MLKSATQRKLICILQLGSKIPGDTLGLGDLVANRQNDLMTLLYACRICEHIW